MANDKWEPGTLKSFGKGHARPDVTEMDETTWYRGCDTLKYADAEEFIEYLSDALVDVEGAALPSERDRFAIMQVALDFLEVSRSKGADWVKMYEARQQRVATWGTDNPDHSDLIALYNAAVRS
jgi:hypothetical protein